MQATITPWQRQFYAWPNWKCTVQRNAESDTSLCVTVRVWERVYTNKDANENQKKNLGRLKFLGSIQNFYLNRKNLMTEILHFNFMKTRTHASSDSV